MNALDFDRLSDIEKRKLGAFAQKRINVRLKKVAKAKAEEEFLLEWEAERHEMSRME